MCLILVYSHPLPLSSTKWEYIQLSAQQPVPFPAAVVPAKSTAEEVTPAAEKLRQIA